MARIERIKVPIPRRLLTTRGALKKAIRERAKVSLLTSLLRIQGVLSENAPKGVTSVLSVSLTVAPRIIETEKGFQGQISAALYSIFIEKGFGGKGKYPPRDVIERWVRIKGIHKDWKTQPWMKRLIPKDIRTKKDTFNMKEKLFLATFFVRKKIATKGVEPNPFISKTLEKLSPEIIEIFKNNFKELGK